LPLLKSAFQRNGGWPKDYQHYEKLNAGIFNDFKNDLHSVKAVEERRESDEGVLKRPTRWDFASNGVNFA